MLKILIVENDPHGYLFSFTSQAIGEGFIKNHMIMAGCTTWRSKEVIAQENIY